MKQAYILDVLAFLGAIAVSANDFMWFWYIAAVYIVFKTGLIYILVMFRRDTLDFEINKEVERKLIKMSNDAKRQLARGDHSPIHFYR